MKTSKEFKMWVNDTGYIGLETHEEKKLQTGGNE